MRRKAGTKRTTGWYGIWHLPGVLAAALLLLATAVPATAFAQSGTITGTVTAADGMPVDGAEIAVVDTRLATLTDDRGEFVLGSVPAGARRLRVRLIGFQTVHEDVSVREGESSRVDVRLETAAFELGDIVVSASRRAQRITEAPATITKIDEEAIQNSVGNSYTGVLKDAPGIDYVQTGVTSATINARGFNSSFNNRMLMIEDGRVAVLPENGLPLGQFTAIPKVDLESVEVLVGPGATLYGADASNGVISLQTKDPKEHPGTTVEVAGGTRDYLDVQFRQAGVLDDGKWGYKVSGERQQAHDFENFLTYDVGGTPVPESGIDWDNEVTRGEAALVRYAGDARLELSGGWSETSAVGQTNVGRNQLENWTYNFQQLRFSHPNAYVSLYRTQSQSGDSYAINRYTTNEFLNPDEDFETLRLMSDWPSDGQMYVAEAQGNRRIDELLNTRFVLGGQLRHDRVSSDEQWLTDRQTGEPLGVDQGSIYLQSETPLTPRLNLILGGRLDDHQDYDSQVSPRAGLVFAVTPEQSLRFTYNRAFKSPTTLQTHFYIPDFVPFVGVFGNREGFTVRDGGGDVLQTIEPLVPETNDTWELGYKGLVGDRVFLDATAYYANYSDFLGSLLPINNPFGAPGVAPTFAHDADGNRITSDVGDQLVLTYQNLGAAKIYGADIGARVAATDDVTLSTSVSLLEVSDLESSPSDPDATAINSPSVKWTVGGDFERLFEEAFAGFLVRHVTGYQFTSGINRGKIPTFNTLDLHAGYRLTDAMQVQLTANNLFGCRTVIEDDPVTPAADGGTTCGFDERHIEMINMPAQGTTVFLGLRYQP